MLSLKARRSGLFGEVRRVDVRNTELRLIEYLGLLCSSYPLSALYACARPDGTVCVGDESGLRRVESE